MPSKNINITLLLFIFIVFVYINTYISLANNFNEINIITKFSLFITIGLCQHFLLNIVHITTHKLGSNNNLLNNIIGSISAFLTGFTFSDFSSTHLLHHKWTTNPKKDPDHFITTFGPIYTIPFKINYHDYYFWKNGLWKKGRWINYISTRILQIFSVYLIIAAGFLNLFTFFWVLPLLIIGFLNGFFLFYFPHYTTKYEERLRKKNSTFFYEKIFLNMIDISRTYHEDHHNSTKTYKSYFPVVMSIWNMLNSKKTRTYPHNLKYTNIFKSPT